MTVGTGSIKMQGSEEEGEVSEIFQNQLNKVLIRNHDKCRPLRIMRMTQSQRKPMNFIVIGIGVIFCVVVLLVAIVGGNLYYNSKLQDKDKRIIALDSQVLGLDSQIGSLNSQITILQNQVSSLNSSTLQDKDNQISALNSQISGLDSQIGSLNNQITILQNQLSNLNGSTLQDKDNQINSLNIQISGLNSQIGILNNQTANLQNQVSNLTDIANLKLAQYWLVSQTVSQTALSASSWNFSASYAGYVWVNVESSTTSSTYIEVKYSSLGVYYDNKVDVGSGGPVTFPVLPGTIEIMVGNSNPTDGATEIVTATYYY
jgi:prefoldin subunit 5